MKQKVIIPANNEEMAAIRKYPQKPIEPPKYSKQKTGIILYSLMLLFVFIMFVASAFFKEINWSAYLLLFLPLSYSKDLFHLFAIQEDGILSGSRYIPWKRIRSFQFIPIDVNHNYYGYAKEVNNGYELKMKGRFFSVSCIVTSDEIKEKVGKVLNEHIKVEKEYAEHEF